MEDATETDGGSPSCREDPVDRDPWPTVALLVVLALVGLATTAVLFLTPPWEANDEPDHVENVTDLASAEWYRIPPAQGGLPENIERHQPPLYYMVLAPIARAFDLDRARPELVGGPDVFSGGARFAHTDEQDAVDRRRVWVLRAPGVAMALSVVVATFLTCRLVTRDRWTPVIAAATVGFVPRFVFTGGTVNNDNLANLLGALLALAAVRVVVRPPGSAVRRVGAAALLGAIVGCLVLAKLSAVPLGLGAAVAILVLGRTWWEKLVLAVSGAGAALLVSGWWLVRNIAWYGDPLAADASSDYLAGVWSGPTAAPGGVEIVVERVPRIILTTFFYISGWNQLRWSWWWSLPFWLLVGGGLAGFLWRGRGRRRPGSSPPQAAWWVLAAIVAGAFAGVWLTALVNDRLLDTVQARLAHPGLPALACLVAVGWERLRVPLALRFALPLVGLVGVVVALWDDVWVLYHA